MTQSEYEAQRRRLDEEMRAAIELVKAGHRTQIRALEELWTRMSQERTPESMAAPPPPEPDSRPWRRGAGELLEEVVEILPRLPALFTKGDVEKALEEPADRASLYRVLQELEQDGWLKTETPGRGRNPTVYRRKVSAASAEDSGDGAETA
ncbi:MAG TPA: hypothetical protein VNW71_09585 [Thermoanaerobaculia bacterium]|nr:hypothetical protein [Thermoanaerobaculia bacterium]